MPDWAAYARERLRLDDLRPERQAEIVEEIAGQLEQAYQDALQRGLSEQEAEAVAAEHVADWDALSAALRESPIGRIPALDQLAERAAERHHARSGILGLFASVWRDVLYGLRLLGKNRGFAAAAILTMAIGIGANTAVFSIVDSAIFFRLPYPNSSRIETIGMQNEFVFRSWERQNKAFSAISASIYEGMTLTGAGNAERVGVEKVTSGFFSVLESKPLPGRAFFASETKRGGSDVAVLAYRLWHDRFGANPKVIGQTIHLNDRLYTVVGVMPKGFQFPFGYSRPISVLLPLHSFSRLVLGPGGKVVSVSIQMANVLGRLKRGISAAGAQADLRTIAGSTRFAAGMPPAKLVSLHDAVVGNNRPTLFMFWGAVGFLLLIACVNLANLALARALAREKEIALRVALGAHRGRVARQLLTESLLVTMLGALGGIGIAYAIVVLFRSLGPGGIPRLADATIDVPVLGFSVVIAMFAGVLAGLAPVREAWKLSTVEALKEGTSTGGGRARRRLRSALVVTEVALAMVLAVGAGLLVRSFLALTAVPIHFDPHNLLTAQIDLPVARYATSEQRREFDQMLVARIRSLPGVVVAAGAAPVYVPTLGPENFSSIQVEGRPVTSAQYMGYGYMNVSPGFFRAAGIHILAGREFQPTDTATSEQVAVVNETFAEKLLPHINPLGQKIRRNISSSAEGWTTIVGLASDVQATDQSVVYRPLAQHPAPEITLLIRTTWNPLALVPALRTQVAQVDSDLPVFSVATMDHLLSEQVATPRFNTALLTAFALIALVLAALGVYGVISYAVSEQTHEIGIRMALGAKKSSVLRMIVGKTLILALIGIGIGIGGALALTRYLRSLLYQIRPDDPWSFAIAAVVLLVAALLAGFVPARRATKIDPLTALRYE